MQHGPLLDGEHGQEGVRGEPASAGERRPDDETPHDEISEEGHEDRAAEVACPAFDQRSAGGELPACEALVQGELEDGADESGPEQDVAKACARHRRGDEVSGADAGGGERQARSDDAEPAEEAARSVLGVF